MGTATPSNILSILDSWVKVFTTIGNLSCFNANVNAGTTILSVSNSAGDINLVALVGVANETATQQSYELTNNRTPLSLQFQQLASWIASNSGTGTSTLNAYLSAANTTVPYTYLVSPYTAFQSFIAPGGSPLPNSSGLSTNNNYLSPSNVFAPIATFGSGNITGTNTATYTNNINLPTSNNGIQIITIANASSGTWTYTYNNQTTSGLAYNISASSLQTAINALSLSPAISVLVSSPSTGVYYVQAVDSFSQSTPNMLSATVSGSGLVGTGASASITNSVSAIWKLVITASGGTYDLPVGTTAQGVYTASAIAFDATASTIQAGLRALLPLGTNVSVSGSAGTYYIALGGILANQRFDYNFLSVNTASLTGGTATLTQTVLGGTQGYTGPSTTNAVVTTTVNGTCALTVTANAVDTSGVFHAGRTFTASLSSATAGTTVPLTPGTAGDRIVRITANSVAGTATAGAFNYTNELDRVIS